MACPDCANLILAGTLAGSKACAVQGQDSTQLAPLMCLYLQHPQSSLAASAHSLFCAMLKQSQQVEADENPEPLPATAAKTSILHLQFVSIHQFGMNVQYAVQHALLRSQVCLDNRSNALL